MKKARAKVKKQPKYPKFLHQVIEIRVTVRHELGPFKSRDRHVAIISSDISHLKSPTNKELQTALFHAKMSLGRTLAKRPGGAGTKRKSRKDLM